MANYNIAVLMSTYNGEKYLSEQIESVLKQKNVHVHIFIRDDKSNDHTVQLIGQYIKKHPEEISLYEEENVGPGCSFMKLLYKVPNTYDYYSFCDQDDIWLDDKLISAIQFLQNTNKDLYIGNLMCVDKNLTEIGLRNIKPPDISPYGIMVMNKTNGCTMVFSNRFYSILSNEKKRPNEIMLKARCHDAWTAMIGSVTNSIAYDFDYHMLYRQHENNVIGATDYNTIKKRLKIKLKKLHDKARRNGRSLIAAEIIKLFPEETKKFPYLAVYADAHKTINKIKLIRSYKKYRNHGEQSFLSFSAYVIFNLI